MRSTTLLTSLCLLHLTMAQNSCPQACTSCINGHVNCAGARLTDLPTSLPEDTLTIDLTQNKITTLDNLPKLSEVQSLRMSMNQLTLVKGNSFADMPSLVSLDLSMNMITKVYKHGFRGLENLMSISLSANKIEDIGVIFKNTPKVTSVRLGNNEIQEITNENFQTNTMIKMLDLSNNKISQIHGDAFKTLDMLRYLILSNNPIKTVTDLSFTSTMLSLADFSNCALTAVPRTMPPSLVDYRLGNNQIERVNVEDFENITSLKMLTLNDNKISHVDHRSFGTLENLKELWMSRNQMVYIPRGLPKALQKLFMDKNVVVELEQMLFKPDSELTELNLEGNKVSKIHKEALENVRKLEKLDLQGNDITRIESGTFTKLPNLQSITLTDNPIEHFESGAFADLESLTEIELSYIEPGDETNILSENFFTTMPDLTSIGMMSSAHLTKAFLEILQNQDAAHLDKVKKLNIQYNDLVTLPEVLKTILPNVKQIILDGNLLACDTRLVWLNQWMAESSVSFHQYEKPTCNSPQALKGQTIAELSVSDFRDPEPEPATQPQQPYPEETEQTPEQVQQPLPASTESSDRQTQPAVPVGQDTEVSKSQVSYYPISGTVVKIKPPSGSRNSIPSLSSSSSSGSRTSSSGSQTSSSSSQTSSRQKKLSKKEARRLERERRRREKEERRRRRQRSKKSSKDDASRKKRRIKKKRQDCRMGADGKEKCGRKRKCTVLEDGTVRCKKRKNKKQKKATE